MYLYFSFYVLYVLTFNMDNNVFNFTKINYILNDGKVEPNKIDVKSQIEERQKYFHNENNKLQEKHLMILNKYNKRINKIQSQKIIKHNKNVEANRKREERIKHQIEVAKILEKCKTEEKIAHIKNKEIKSQKLLAVKENLRLYKKQNNDMTRYFEKVKHQNQTFIENQMLMNRCLNGFGSYVDSVQDLSSSQGEEIENEELIEIHEEEECVLQPVRII